MIPAEAVEAATKAIIDSLLADEMGWVDADVPNDVTIDVRWFDLTAAISAALEAAAPYMLADLTRERDEARAAVDQLLEIMGDAK